MSADRQRTSESAHRIAGPPNQTSCPFVSVIVPVYNDLHRLQRCLAALEALTYPQSRYEVVVIDNGSTVPVAGAVDAFPHARVVNEPRPGCAQARMTGIEHSTGAILAFTDADCVPEPQWLTQGVACLGQTPRCGLVGGHIAVFAQDPARPTLAEVVSVAMHLKQERFVRAGHWAVAANAFTLRSIVDAVGPMNPQIESSSEIAWGLRVHRAGYEVVYCPDAVVRHPARRSLRDLCRRSIRLECGWQQLRSREGVGRGVDRWLGQYLLSPLGATFQDVIRNPQLTTAQKAGATAVSCFLVQLRIVAYALMRMGVQVDVRKSWG